MATRRCPTRPLRSSSPWRQPGSARPTRPDASHTALLIQMTSATISRIPTIVQITPLFMFNHPARVKCDGIRSGVVAML